MSSDVGVNDAEQPVLDVAPADNTTTAMLTALKPDGTSAAIAVSGGAPTAIDGTDPVQYTQRWAADQPLVYDAPGRWVLHWDVAGTGEGAEDFEVYVVASPVAGGPTWAPGRSRVAAYVPHRTLERSLSTSRDSEEIFDFTFTQNTVPNGVQVDRLIADGVDWITALVTPMNTKSQAACALMAALWAAIGVERAWPADDETVSLQRANDMEKRLDALLAALIKSNADANTADGGSSYPTAAALPVWNFPPAPCDDRPYGYGQRFHGYPYY